MLIKLGGVRSDVRLCLLEIILEHSPHTVELEGLVGVHLVLQLFLLLALALLLDLLVEPLLLLILKELFAGIVF